MISKKLKINEKFILKPLEYSLILALSQKDTLGNENGWFRQKTLLKIREPQLYDMDNNIINEERDLLFKSQSTNIPKYINSLINMGIVEEKIVTKKDRNGRNHDYKYWRLKESEKVFNFLSSSILEYCEIEYNKYILSNKLTEEEIEFAEFPLFKPFWFFIESKYFKDIRIKYKSIGIEYDRQLNKLWKLAKNLYGITEYKLLKENIIKDLEQFKKNKMEEKA